ncbi:MAG: zf-HC2 domain-containing protein [Acidobacteriota bacterium]
MKDHLSTQLLERFRERRLEPQELLALDDHLAACAACREMLRETRPLSASLLALRASIENDESALDHLREDQLMAYAAGKLDEVDRELAESHLESCAACAAQSQKLSVGQRADISDQASKPALWARLVAERLSSVRPALRIAAAVAMALLVIAVVLWLRSGTERQEIVEHPPAPQPSPPQPETPASILLALNDGPKQITLDAQGKLTGLESLSPADQQSVRTALTTEKVFKPATLRELIDSSAPSMGRPDASTFALLYPIGKIIASNRPTLRWRPLDGAISYQVTITDPKDGYKEIATSPDLQNTKWTVDRKLERGRIYNWQATARTESGEEKAPAADAPEAKFKVLERAKLNEIARAKKDYAGRHLVLGLIYAQAGLIDEAEREFKSLVRDNPQSAVAKNLLRDLRAHRR